MDDDNVFRTDYSPRQYYDSALAAIQPGHGPTALAAIQPGQVPTASRYTLLSLFRALMMISLKLGVLAEERKEFWRFFTLVLIQHRNNAPDLLLMVGRNRMRRLPRMRESQRVVMPPGQKLLSLAEILFSPKTVTLTFEPLIADWQFEYFEALKAKLPSWRLRIISIRYCWHYAKACGLSKVVQLFRAVARK